MDEVGVSRKTFYSWMKDPRYLDYVNSQLDQYTNSELADIWRALINQAKRGSLQHIKLFFEMKGMYVEKREVTGKDGGPIQTQNIELTDEELDASIARLAKELGYERK